MARNTTKLMIKYRCFLEKKLLEMFYSTSSSSPKSLARAHSEMCTRSETLPNSSKLSHLSWRYQEISKSWAKKFKPWKPSGGGTRQRLYSPEHSRTWLSTWVLWLCLKYCLTVCLPNCSTKKLTAQALFLVWNNSKSWMRKYIHSTSCQNMVQRWTNIFSLWTKTSQPKASSTSVWRCWRSSRKFTNRDTSMAT